MTNEIPMETMERAVELYFAGKTGRQMSEELDCELQDAKQLIALIRKVASEDLPKRSHSGQPACAIRKNSLGVRYAYHPDHA